MNRRNFQREMEGILQKWQGAAQRPRLLLHSCCAPCSSYVLEYLSEYFDITILYYNPNIAPEAEYEKRLAEQRRLVCQMGLEAQVLAPAYDAESFYAAVRGLEHCPEGGERCRACINMRLAKAAALAQEGGYDYFCTTLTISPLKNAQVINELGEALAAGGVAFLPSDFKKREGYKRSIKLSREYGLYRQDYCGCVFSRREPAEL